MEKLEGKLVDVTEIDGKINLLFLANDRVYEVGWNKKAYDSTLGQFIESEQKEAQVEEWAQNYFKCSVDNLKDAIGTVCPIYSYDTYCSLWESQVKFTKDDNRKNEVTTIDEIDVTEDAIYIYYKFDGQKHRSRMGYSTKVGNEFYQNPIKKKKQFANFQDKYGVPVEEKDKLIGKKIKVTVKKAFNSYYGDITYLE